MKARITRYDALAAVDAAGFCASPASLLVESPAEGGGLPRLLAAGAPAEVSAHPAAAPAEVVALPGSVLIPGLVNAHTHLDLTHMGPRPFEQDGGFGGWVEMIRTGRETDEAAIEASVRRGVELSLAGGTVAVGDIGGAPVGRPTLVPWRTLRSSVLMGVSFLEFFAIGKGEERGVRAAADAVALGLAERASARETELDARLGLQPHAPHTVGLGAFRRAIEIAAEAAGRPPFIRGIRSPLLSTHLAETVEEQCFIHNGGGPHREFLERLGLWSDEILDTVGKGRTPVEHLFEVLATAPFIAAHVNSADDAAIRLLARTRTTVAYCPRASDYFGAAEHFGPHRYREMLGAGINVALGTDSIVNLSEDAARPESGGMSILDEMRHLYRRDNADPAVLLKMGTVNGAVALGLDPAWFGFRSGPRGGRFLAGLVAVDLGDGASTSDPLRGVMASNGAPRLLFHRSLSG